MAIMLSATSGLMWGALTGSPLLGAAVGVLYGLWIKPLRHSDRNDRLLIALLGLFITASMVIAARGVLDVFAHWAWRDGWWRAILAVAAAPISAFAGLTFTGLALILWPLSIANHWLVWRVQLRADPSA